MKRFLHLLLLPAALLAKLSLPTRGDESQGGWVIVPFPIYSPETDFAMTLTTLHHFRAHETTQASSVMLSGAYSLNRQTSVRLAPEVSLFGDRAWFEGDISYENWPDVFYGVGHNSARSDEEDYTSRNTGVEGTLLRKVFSALSLGVVAEFRHYDIAKLEDDGLLAAQNVRGSDGAEVIGGGLVAAWDDREDRFAAERGTFLRVAGLGYYDQSQQSSFQKLRLDARQYQSLGRFGVLATQQYINLLRGDAPFQELSRIGDIREISLMRGIYSGRYIDKHVGVLQGEWRYPIAWRFSGTLFGGVGIIGSDLLRTSESSVYTSGGAGLRYRASKTERINLRLDVAVGEESSGVYFGLMEAF